jgi:hypothetical protein
MATDMDTAMDTAMDMDMDMDMDMAMVTAIGTVILTGTAVIGMATAGGGAVIGMATASAAAGGGRPAVTSGFATDTHQKSPAPFYLAPGFSSRALDPKSVALCGAPEGQFATGAGSRAPTFLLATAVVANRRRTSMKKLSLIIAALGLAVVFASPGVAADKMPTTKAACEKAKMHWDNATKSCTKSNM